MSDDIDELLGEGIDTIDTPSKKTTALEDGEMRAIWFKMGRKIRIRGRWAIDTNEERKYIHVHRRHGGGYYLPLFSDLKKIVVNDGGRLVKITTYDELLSLRSR